MQTTSTNASSSSWQTLRSLYDSYCALAREFVIEMQPCPALETGTGASESIIAAREWLADMDHRIQIHQLRQFIQTSAWVNDEILRALLLHHLQKERRTDHDRDKVDFLLIQLFSQLIPANFSDADLNLPAVAKALEPVLGKISLIETEWLKPLDGLLEKAKAAKNLNALFTGRIIEAGRDIKASCGDKFFEPEALAAFARFGFLIRRAFFRLMHQDLNAILDGLRELESRGATTLDCRKAQFAADEPIARLRMICQSWKVMFHAEYSSGQPLCLLVDLRTAVESALVHSARLGGAAIKPKASAARAARGTGAAPEFEVSATSEAWDDEAGQGSDGASEK